MRVVVWYASYATGYWSQCAYIVAFPHAVSMLRVVSIEYIYTHHAPISPQQRRITHGKLDKAHKGAVFRSGISLKWEWETHQNNAGGKLTKVRNPLAILSGIPTKIFMGIPRYRFSEIPGTEMRIPLGPASRGGRRFRELAPN